MNEKQKEYEEWLLSLKEGDTVAYNSRYHGYSTLVINKITPTRQIKTNSGYTFKNGHEMGGHGWDSITIEPYSQKVKDAISKKDAIRTLRSIRFDELNIDQLERILQITREDL